VRATWERHIGRDLNPITLGMRVLEEVTSELVRVKLPDANVVLVLDMADLDRLRAKMLAQRPCVPVDPDAVLAPEVGGEG
jgi:hypothetical protein